MKEAFGKGNVAVRHTGQGITLVHFQAQRKHLLRDTLGSVSGSVTRKG
jgi:hypothetical protein